MSCLSPFFDRCSPISTALPSPNIVKCPNWCPAYACAIEFDPSGNKLPENKKSYGLSLNISSNEKTLSDKEIGDEVAAQKWFQVNRVTWKSIFAFTICISVLFIPIIQHLPFGVDWIGFSVLSSQLAQTESLNLTGNFLLKGQLIHGEV